MPISFDPNEVVEVLLTGGFQNNVDKGTLTLDVLDIPGPSGTAAGRADEYGFQFQASGVTWTGRLRALLAVRTGDYTPAGG